MQIKIISVGKKNDALFDEAIKLYSDRLKSFVAIDWIFVKPCSLGQNKAPGIEAQHILARTSSNEPVWLLDEAGRQIDSSALSSKLQNFKDKGAGKLNLIIGGAYGVDTSVKKRADFVWSFSNLTFPHQLMRLMLAEQLYRAFSITAGSKYHHGNV
jgi:23S rRNA (pseudouridine1915-N3)-methyltransferase